VVPLGNFLVVQAAIALIFRGQLSAVDCAHDLVLLHQNGVNDILLVIRTYKLQHFLHIVTLKSVESHFSLG